LSTEVTADPGEVVAQVHDRSPVALPWSEASRWLDTAEESAALAGLLDPRDGQWELQPDTRHH
jgi:putative SOS response-associated peptidase YedK